MQDFIITGFIVCMILLILERLFQEILNEIE